MSDKLIRDELLRSHRYVSLSNDTTKLLFLHLTLSSDSLSNAEATTTALSIIMGRHITESAAATLLSELADHDLIRPYDANGKRYVHIPRSRQRIRYLTGKHPRPPVGVEDIEIRELIAKVGLRSDRGQTQVGPFTPEVKRSEVKRSEEKREASAVAGAPAPSTSKPALQGKGSRLPTDWFLPDEWRDWAKAVRPDWTLQGIVRESLTFRDWWHSKAGKDACKVNWFAVWRTWIRRAEMEPTR